MSYANNMCYGKNYKMRGVHTYPTFTDACGNAKTAGKSQPACKLN